jgi:hypothetical protein
VRALTRSPFDESSERGRANDRWLAAETTE